jgi:hypothetical protein
MKTKKVRSTISVLVVLNLVMSACGVLATEAPTSTPTPQPTATQTLVPTATFTPTATPRPTRTPNLAATQRYEGFNAEAQKYAELGYLSTETGRFVEYDDFKEEWAQLGWYRRWILDEGVSDFFMTAHVKWSSAYRNADISGCGIFFASQENGDHYAVFLDRSEILVLNADQTSGYSRKVGLTRGTGRVKFGNPADQPVEANLTVIVNGAYVYVLVDGEVVGEYTLSQSRVLTGGIGVTLLSGTNADYGTRCEMTDIHAWIQD